MQSRLAVGFISIFLPTKKSLHLNANDRSQVQVTTGTRAVFVFFPHSKV